MTESSLLAEIALLSEFAFLFNEDAGVTVPVERLGKYASTGLNYSNCSRTSSGLFSTGFSGTTRVTTSGSAGSAINLGNLAGVGPRINSAGGFSFCLTMTAGSQNSTTRNNFLPMMGFSAGSGANQFKFGRDAAGRFAITASIGGVNVSSSGSIWAFKECSDIFTGDVPHSIGITYRHNQSIFDLFIDGVFFATANPYQVSGSSYLRALEFADFSNFMIGAFSFNGANVTGPFASTAHFMAGTAGMWSEEAHRRIHELGTQKHPQHKSAFISGPRAASIIAERRRDLINGKRVFVFEGDSTMSGYGTAIAAEIARVSGGKIAGLAIPLGTEASADNTYTPSRYSNILTSGSSVTRQISLTTRTSRFERTGEVATLGAGPTVLGASSIDWTQGMRLLVQTQKSASPGSLNVKVTGSSDVLLDNTATDAVYMRTLLDVTIPAIELTGAAGTFVDHLFAVPGAERWNYLKFVVTSNSASNNTSLIIPISVANENGSIVIECGRGGMQVGNFNTTWAGRWAMYAHRGVTDLISNFGLNDGLDKTVDQIKATIQTYIAQAIAGLPTLKAIDLVTPTAKAFKMLDSNSLPSTWTDHATSQLAGAYQEIVDADPSLPIVIAHLKEALHRWHGWNAITQSQAGLTLVTHTAAATLTAGQAYDVAYEQGGAGKKTVLGLQAMTAGQSLMDENYALPIARFTKDGTHHTSGDGTIAKYSTMARLMMGEGLAQTSRVWSSRVWSGGVFSNGL